MKTRPFLLALTIGSLAWTTVHNLAPPTYEPYSFMTLAGRADGTGSAARFCSP